MANLKNIKRPAGKSSTAKNINLSEKGDRVLFWIETGFQTINDLSMTFNSVSSTIDDRKATEIDNSVKLSKAETEAKMEENRHDESMAKIEQEWKKITDSASDRERRLSFIEGQILKFQEEYDKYMGMETDEFLSQTVTSRLDSLRNVIIELTKELNRIY